MYPCIEGIWGYGVYREYSWTSPCECTSGHPHVHTSVPRDIPSPGGVCSSVYSSVYSTMYSPRGYPIATYLLPSVVPTRGHSTMCSSYAYLRREVCRGVDAHLVGVHTYLCSCIHSSVESCVCTPHSAISLPHRGHSTIRRGVHSSVESAVHSY